MKLKTSEEKAFLLRDVVQIPVLSHAPAFQQYDLDAFLSIIEEGEAFAEEILAPLNRQGDREGVRVKDGVIETPLGFGDAWRKIRQGGWIKLGAGETFQGKGFPDSVGVAVQEAFFAANPGLCFYYLSTVECARLIGDLGSDLAYGYARKLYEGEWTGAFALEEAKATDDPTDIRTLARDGGDYYVISGAKRHVVAGLHDLAENQVHVVLAYPTGEGDEVSENGGLYFVPVKRWEDGRLVDNHVRLEAVVETNGVRGVPFCTIRYGEGGECRGYRLSADTDEIDQTIGLLEGWRLRLALLGVAQTDLAIDFLMRFFQNRFGSVETIGSENRIPEILLLLQSLCEGTRGAVYSAAFFRDCQVHGAASKKDYFGDLAALYSIILKVYLTDISVELIQTGIQSMGNEGFETGHPLEQILRDVKSGLVMGGHNRETAEEFLFQVLIQHEGRLFQNLMTYFKSLEMHLARSEALNEAIGILKDFIGGLIILFDDLMNSRRDQLMETYRIHAGRILRLFGDVITCYHLVQQGLQAERVMADSGINFYNLHSDVLAHPDNIKWYNKLITAEYFALHVLSMQDSVIRLLQRNPQTLSDYFL